MDLSVSSDFSDGGRSSSPELILDKSSRTFQDQTAQDDVAISTLERKLRIRSQDRLPKAFVDDGLDDLLQGLGKDLRHEKAKRKREGQDWLESKRRRHGVSSHNETIGLSKMDSFGEGKATDSLDGESRDQEVEGLGQSDDVFDGFSETEKQRSKASTISKRENPYIAPPTSSSPGIAKYTPPSLRQATAPRDQVSEQLHRQIQRNLNKLSEANLLSILAEIEKLYRVNPKRDVTWALINLLLSTFCDPAILQNTFIILHASFVAAVYNVAGPDFGATFVSQLVERFEEHHHRAAVEGGKQSVNLISLLGHLFTFHVVSSSLIFDYVRILLQTLSETNAELLLRIVRDIGPQLRQDDPSSLKAIVLQMHSALLQAQAEGTSISIRTKFMVETITDLKNNKLKTQFVTARTANEHVTRMRKVLGTMKMRTNRHSEPLRFGLSDLKNADKRGQWWLMSVGRKEVEASANDSKGCDQTVIQQRRDSKEEPDLIHLAREHQMNTNVRKSIFVAVMSATDYNDAYVRLMKLRLRRSQEQEISRVLIYCAGIEEHYNPYYTLIAKKLCEDRRQRMGLQFGLWAIFRRMGEDGDGVGSGTDDSDVKGDGEPLQMEEIVNVAKMFGQLIASEALPLGILKTLNFFLIQRTVSMLVEVLLTVIISKSQEGQSPAAAEDRLASIFAVCKHTPHMIPGLRHFLKKKISHTDLVASENEGDLVRRGCRVALDTLFVISDSGREWAS